MREQRGSWSLSSCRWRQREGARRGAVLVRRERDLPVATGKGREEAVFANRPLAEFFHHGQVLLEFTKRPFSVFILKPAAFPDLIEAPK